MYHFQGTNNRSNGIYCEPDTSHHHHFSPPHMNKKMTKMRTHQHRGSRINNSRTQHLPQHRNDPGMDSEVDSSSEVSDGTYPDSEGVHPMTVLQQQTRMNITQQNGGGGGPDSPPEPAPSDLPLRHNGGLRSLKPNRYDGADMDLDSEHSSGYHLQPNSGVYHPQEYLMSSPYQPKSPLPMGVSLATAKKFFQGDNHQNETADSNSTLSTLPSQARLIGGGPSLTNPMMAGMPSAPVILPVFPNSTPHSGQLVTGNGVQNNSRSLPRTQYSPSRFTLQKDCRVSDRCSWKCISVALILLCVALISILIYFAAIMGNCGRHPATGCIVVEDAKVMARGEKHYPVIDLTSISPKSNEVDMVSPTSLVPEVTSRGFGDYNDGSTPTEISWGQELSRRIEPYSYWTLEMNLRDSAYVNLNLSIPWSTNWALLFRKNSRPSITQHDVLKVVRNGRLEHKNKRRHVRYADNSWKSDNDRQLMNLGLVSRERRDTSGDPHVIVVTEHLEAGQWFIKIFNDGALQRYVKVIASKDSGNDIPCAQQCNGNGNCVFGKCHCFEGYTSSDCSISICPVLCSNHGRYGGGVCHCDVGWKGAECDIPESECEIGNCHGNGDCVNGKCICKAKWTGEFCDQSECTDPTCSHHGTCIQGKCLCETGWTGHTCSFPDSLLNKCLPDCSGRGSFDVENGKCVCQKPYGGSNCEQVTCDRDCGTNGVCNEGGQCECIAGWTGDNCEVMSCDPRCQEHGQCKNGTCVCSVGWNGKHCTLVGCHNGCSHHGTCIMQEGLYSCKCASGWASQDCSIRLETNCSDDVDNDEDELSDCSDSECCDNPVCKEHLMCMTANDPVEVLLRKQPPSVTSSFYQRVKFLIEEDSVQSYAQKDEYWERRVSVIRGQVLSADGLGVVGIRVGVEKSQRLGFTLTRKGGWFDMLVNGGGSVTLHFQRAPFKALTRTVFVPWNEIVVLDPPVVLTVQTDRTQARETSSSDDDRKTQAPCLQHNIDVLNPKVISSWLPAMVGANPGSTHVFGETQILQESILIPGSNVHLLYHSSQSQGYLATILMELTGPQIPAGLILVHLKITIEGELYKRTFEADPNITYTFGWKRRNVYQQKVYGLATARVSIGYEYSTCALPIWTVRTVSLKGFDVDIADIGGWNLDIHHHYNFQEGILQKGDGSEVHLRELPRRVTNVLGRKGHQRSLLCEPCEDLLLSPIALGSGPDGSIYVGDFNMIRRITPRNHTYTILQLSATKVSQQYYMTISPADGHLYISDPEKYQVLRVNKMDDIEDPRVNWSPVVGSGRKCVPGDIGNCGDGFEAKVAKLSHPKGLAITAGGSMYIADGPNIRFVDSHGIIHTLVGKHSHWSMRQTLVKSIDFESCRVFKEEISKVQLHWPTNLALNLLENKLVFVDEGTLFQITEDNQIERVLKCDNSNNLGKHVADVAFSSKGELYFVTEDANLYMVRSNSKITLVQTEYRMRTSEVANKDKTVKSNLNANSISSMCIGADGNVYFTDQANVQLKQVSTYIPSPNLNGDYEVVFAETGEIYVFNRYGQHILTKDLKSGKTLYTFIYNKNTSYGKLFKISDGAENKIIFWRDYSSVVNTIDNAQGEKCSVKINHLGRLVQFQETENSEIKFDYSDDGLLLAKRTKSGLSSLYSHDRFGRIRRVIGETGIITSFDYELVGYSIQVVVSDSSGINGLTRYDVSRNEESDQIIITQLSPENIPLRRRTIYNDLRNVSYTLKTESGVEISGSSFGVYPLLKEHMPIEGNLLRAPSFQHIAGDRESQEAISNSQEWKFGSLGDSTMGPDRILDRQIWVNDTRVLALEFDQSLSRETIYNREREPIFSIQYDQTGLPLYFIPLVNQNYRYTMNISYDPFRRIENWKWGSDRGCQISYGRHGFATELKRLDGVNIMTAEYNDQGKLSKMSLRSGRAFKYHYDEFGGLSSIETPKNTHHRFTFQYSVGFTKLVYQAPGVSSSKIAFVKYFNSNGLLESILLPPEAGKVFMLYDFLKRPAQTLYSQGKITYKYKNRQTTILVNENKFESTTHVWRNSVTKITQEKQEFGAKSGLSSSKFVYEYDNNLRPILCKSRIGGNVMPDLNLGYNSKSGLLDRLGNFHITYTGNNENTIFDGIAVFSMMGDGYGQPVQYVLTIQGTEVFRLDMTYQSSSHKLQQIKIATKNIGQSSFIRSRNFTYDLDGQLTSVESSSPESEKPWHFEYDSNSNLKRFTHGTKIFPLEHNQEDQIISIADGLYRYDAAGRVVQTTDSHFVYNSLGQLRRARKSGNHDVEYFYDGEGRIVAKKENNQGNTNMTQYLYGDVRNRDLITHIYNPKENRLLHLTYDESKRLIFFQVNRAEKFYVGSDNCGTPIAIFNQHGKTVKLITRSPFGLRLDDNDLFLPIDFCGGLLDTEGGIIHMRNKRVYDPVIGQYLTPDWETLLNKYDTPEKLHLYRLNGNDPLNVDDIVPGFDHGSWLRHLGYNLESIAPQLYRTNIGLPNPQPQLVVSGMESRVLEKVYDESLLRTIPKSVVTKSLLIPEATAAISQIEPPLGKNILLSRTEDGKAMISCPFCTSNRIYSDVFTQILNGSEFLSYVSHSPTQDVFHFAKKEIWKASDDLAELKRLSGQVNVTVHDRAQESQVFDIKIQMSGSILSLKYGMTGAKEQKRLLHHAQTLATRKAWSHYKDMIRGGFPVSEFTAAEKEEILKNGHISSHHADFVHEPEDFPIFADDPLNIHFVKKTKSQRNRSN